MGDGKIVSFKEIKNGRPLEIIEMVDKDNIDYPDAIGLAYSRFTGCLIKIKKGLSKHYFRETLIHEYLHCYGYGHSESPEDLMYYAINKLDKEENIRQYAIKVKKKFYE